MADEPEKPSLETDVTVEAGTYVEIDAEVIARIILSECHTSVGRATTAANRVIDYLMEVHSKGGKVAPLQ